MAAPCEEGTVVDTCWDRADEMGLGRKEPRVFVLEVWVRKIRGTLSMIHIQDYQVWQGT